MHAKPHSLGMCSSRKGPKLGSEKVEVTCYAYAEYRFNC